MSTQNNCQQSYFPVFSLSHNTFHPYIQEPEPIQSFNHYQCTYLLQPENINLQYYEEYKKLYFTSYCISLQLNKIAHVTTQLVTQISKIEEKIQDEARKDSQQQNQSKLKRFRRKADQIERRFFCQGQRCGRNYGSQGSLQQHIKLKHPELCKQSYHTQFSGDENL